MKKELNNVFITENDILLNNIQLGLHIYRLEDRNDDHSLKLVSANHVAEVMTGVKNNLIIGKYIDEAFPNAREKKLPQKYSGVVKSGKAIVLEVVYYGDDRIPMAAFSVNAFPLDENHVCISFENISEKKKAEEELKISKNKLQSLFDNMTNAFAYHRIVLDDKGNPIDYIFLELNNAFEDFTGLKRENIIGRKVTEAIPGFTESAFDWVGIYGKVALSQEPTKFIQYFEPLNKWYSILAYSPEKEYFAVIFDNITEMIETQEEIKRLNEELEDRVKERTAQLESANKELESFSYSISHDLRAPLRHISSFSSLLYEEVEDCLNKGSLRYFDNIKSASLKMEKLIDDLLKFSRLSRDEVIKLDINLGKVIKDSIDMLKDEIKYRNIDWKIKNIKSVKGDLSMIRQVMFNLISNAVKYTKKKRKGIIEVGQKKKGNENIVYVKDNGAGFDESYKDKLFGVFQRLHADKEFEGTGIGLALVKRIIERHGGRVWAEGKINKGSTFYFSLPQK